MKILIVKNIEYGYESIINAEHVDMYKDEYVVLTQEAEVDFVMLSNKEVVGKEIVFLDKEIEKTMADSEVKINNLKQKKQELLAIGCDDSAMEHELCQ